MPETNEATIGRLSRAWRGVWNSRLQYTGDFDTLAEALAAIVAAYPEADRIRCY
jgi:enoyl reductase-like protein